MKTLSVSLAFFRMKAAQGMQYRAAGLSGAATGTLWCLIEIAVYTAFYRYAQNRDAVSAAALTLPQMVTYSWIGQALFSLLPHGPDGDILQKIRSGDVALELCRPLDLYAHWFTRAAAGKVAPFVWRGIPILLAGIFMPFGWGVSAPASPAHFLLFLLSCVSMLLLSLSFNTLVAAVRMSISWGDGPMYLMTLIPMVLSGGYLPLQLWPAALQKALLLQPFAGLMDIPLRLYLGTLPLHEAVLAITLQLLWCAVFVLLGRMGMRKRLGSIVVQGG